MKKAIFTGSFDPFTLGHWEVVNEALQSYDKIIINVGKNSSKLPLFSVEERLKMIEETFSEFGLRNKVELIADNGLTADIALKEKVFSLVRGIRNNLSDLQEERALAEINAELGKIRGINLETAFIFKDSAISSSTVKSLCQLGEFIAVQSTVSSFVHQKLMEVYLKPYLRYFPVLEREDSRGVFDAKLFEAYKDRAYHNLSHIGYMLNMLHIYQRHVTGSRDLSNLNELVLAIFMHDYVHDSLAVDNEEKSVEALKQLEQSYFYRISYREKIENLILATKHDKLAANEDEALIADLDLSIFGTFSEASWRWYNHNIRKEFSNVCDDYYRGGRIAILEKFLQRPRIFQTEFFYDKFEQRARKNIQDEITRLKTVPLL